MVFFIFKNNISRSKNLLVNLLVITSLSYILFSDGVKADCADGYGCYNSQAHPCVWTAMTCCFKRNEIIFNCLNVPGISTVTATCTSADSRNFSMNVLDETEFAKHFRGLPSTKINGAQADIMDATLKTYTFLTSGATQNYHLTIDLDDDTTCADITCTFTTV